MTFGLYYFITQNVGEIIGKQYHFQFKLIIISKTYNNVYINGRYYCSEPDINKMKKKYVHIKCKLKGVSTDCFRLRGTK